MLKERYGNIITFWIISFIMFLLTIIIIITNPIINTGNLIIQLLIGIVLIILFCGGLLFFPTFSGVIIMITIQDYIDKKSYLKSLEEIKHLPNEFSEIILKNNNETSLSRFIPNKEIKCVAKLNEDGNIIYKIHVDIEATTTDYKAFLENFII